MGRNLKMSTKPLFWKSWFGLH